MPENKKKSRPKKLVKSNKSISRTFFNQNPFFAMSKMAKNQFLNLRKMDFGQKKFVKLIYLISRVIIWLDILNFQARCGKIEKRALKKEEQFMLNILAVICGIFLAYCKNNS